MKRGDIRLRTGLPVFYTVTRVAIGIDIVVATGRQGIERPADRTIKLAPILVCHTNAEGLSKFQTKVWQIINNTGEINNGKVSPKSGC